MWHRILANLEFMGWLALVAALMITVAYCFWKLLDFMDPPE